MSDTQSQTEQEAPWLGDAFLEMVAGLPDEALSLPSSDCGWVHCASPSALFLVSSGFPPWAQVGSVLDGGDLSYTNAELWSEDKDPGVVTATSEAGVVTSLRLRKRGVLTRTLEGAALKSCWWSDLADFGVSPARAWLISYLGETGVKVLAGTKDLLGVVNEVTTKFTALQVPFSSEEGSADLWVLPELLALLTSVRMFRPMTEGLLASLRSRARRWGEEHGVSVMDLVRCLPGTLALACLPMRDEVIACGAFRGEAARWSSTVLGALDKGLARGPNVLSSWRDALLPIFNGGVKETLKPSVSALKLPS